MLKKCLCVLILATVMAPVSAQSRKIGKPFLRDTLSSAEEYAMIIESMSCGQWIGDVRPVFTAMKEATLPSSISEAANRAAANAKLEKGKSASAESGKKSRLAWLNPKTKKGAFLWGLGAGAAACAVWCSPMNENHNSAEAHASVR